jgi:hypothetical protein
VVNRRSHNNLIDKQKFVTTIIGMGRKRLPDDVRKATYFRFRATVEELEAIETAARSVKKSPSKWARDLLLKAAKRLETK